MAEPALQQPASSVAEARVTDAERERFQRAMRQVEAIKGFYIHVTVFALVMALLAVVNFVTGSPLWVHWVFFGWGVGVIGHAIGVYGRSPRVFEDWERRKLKQLLAER